MAIGYTRQSSAQIADGTVIFAAQLNNEFNQLQSAFDATTGHDHDGTVGGGAAIPASHITGLAASATTDTTNATNISSGQFTLARMPGLTGAYIWVGNASNAPAAVAMSGDATLSNAGVITVTKTNGTALGTAATLNVGTGANSIVQLNGSAQLPAVSGALLTNLPAQQSMTGEYYPIVDKGTVSTGTVTFTVSGGNYQRLQVGGALTIALAGWAASGNDQFLILELVNGGSATITWPTVNWLKSDASGTTTTTFSSAGYTLQTSGTDFVLLWTRDGGTTLYGKVVR